MENKNLFLIYTMKTITETNCPLEEPNCPLEEPNELAS